MRAGRRQRLTDAILTVSSQWLARQNNDDTLSEQTYRNYLTLLEESTKRRGESIYELNLLELIERFTGSNPQAFAQHEVYWSGTVLSIAMAVCRDEDFVANIEGRGPVAVLRSKKKGWSNSPTVFWSWFAQPDLATDKIFCLLTKL